MNDDLSILLAAEPAWLSETIEPPPALPDFAPSPLQVNDPRRPLPILVTTDQGKGDGNLFTAKTISFLAPTNGAFGIFQAYIKGKVEEP